MSKPFSRTLRPCAVKIGDKYASVFVRVSFDGSKLSIAGVEGPLSSGNCRGSCGQLSEPQEPRPAPGWDRATISKLWKVWRAWHLNSMRPGCEHQRAEGWDKQPIDPSKPTNAYGKHFEGQRQPSWNMLTWVSEKEHPKGLLSKPCPTCGYKYGTQWLHEDVPQDVLEFLSQLPKSYERPAWV